MSGMNDKLERLVRWFFAARTERLWHPDSPGVRVTVTRTRFGRRFKSSDFATLREVIKSYSVNADMSLSGGIPYE